MSLALTRRRLFTARRSFNLLYEVMEGDVIRTVSDHHEHFDRYHTAGNPGLHEPDDSQELNYPAICRAIRDTGFLGDVARELDASDSPAEPMARALRAGVGADRRLRPPAI